MRTNCVILASSALVAAFMTFGQAFAQQAPALTPVPPQGSTAEVPAELPGQAPPSNGQEIPDPTPLGIATGGPGVSLQNVAPPTSELPPVDRGNPFVAPPKFSEVQEKLDARTRIIFKELEPGLKQDLIQQVTSMQAQLEIKMRKRIDLMSQTLTAGATAPGMPGKGPGAKDQNTKDGKPASLVPEDAVFISCVNSEALYRDKNNILLKLSKDDPQSVTHCGK